MKKRKSPEFDQPTYFSGRCEKCGEVYEAQSKNDDLEGITFKCKKVVCAGRITLGAGSMHSVAAKEAPSHPSQQNDSDKPPRRYC